MPFYCQNRMNRNLAQIYLRSKWCGLYHPCNRWKREKRIGYHLKAPRSLRSICTSVEATPGRSCQEQGIPRLQQEGLTLPLVRSDSCLSPGPEGVVGGQRLGSLNYPNLLSDFEKIKLCSSIWMKKLVIAFHYCCKIVSSQKNSFSDNMIKHDGEKKLWIQHGKYLDSIYFINTWVQISNASEWKVFM